jgi:Stage IV sporulation protein A (spore_IV_A).
MAVDMVKSFGRTVLPVSCLDLDESQLVKILLNVLFQFPVRELDLSLPRSVTILRQESLALH